MPSEQSILSRILQENEAHLAELRGGLANINAPSRRQSPGEDDPELIMYFAREHGYDAPQRAFQAWKALPLDNKRHYRWRLARDHGYESWWNK